MPGKQRKMYSILDKKDGWTDEFQRKADPVHAGKIRDRSAVKIYTGDRCGLCTGLRLVRGSSGSADPLFSGVDPGDLQLLQGVFQKCDEALCGKPGIPGEDLRDPEFLPEAEEYLAAAESISHLYMPVL